MPGCLTAGVSRETINVGRIVRPEEQFVGESIYLPVPRETERIAFFDQIGLTFRAVSRGTSVTVQPRNSVSRETAT